MEYTKEQLHTQYKKISPQSQEALFSTEIATKIRNLAQKYGLESAQTRKVVEEVGLILLELHQRTDLQRNLAEKLQLPENTIREIANEIASSVLSAAATKGSVNGLAPETGARDRTQQFANAQAQRQSGTPPQINMPRYTNEVVHTDVGEEGAQKEKTKPFSNDPYREPLE